MPKSLDTLLEELKELEEKTKAYSHAMGIISYDALTGAPAGGADAGPWRCSPRSPISWRRGRKRALCSTP